MLTSPCDLPVCGAVDSVASVRGAADSSVYMQVVLQVVYERTGLRCILVAPGGLAFRKVCDASRTYHHGLHDVSPRITPYFLAEMVRLAWGTQQR